MDELLLTVSMPNYNHGRYLSDRIASLLAAMPFSSELLIVDDGSTDQSVEIIERFLYKDTRIKLIKNPENKGVNYSLNIILKNAKGKYLTFQSADDFIMPDFFKKILYVAQKYPEAGICCSDPAICYEDTMEKIHTLRLLENISEAHFFPPSQAVEIFRSTGFWIAGHTAVVKREAILKLGGFDKRLEPHDDWFLLHGVALREGVAYLPEALAIWKQAVNGYSGTILTNKKRKKEVNRQLLKVLSLKKNQSLRTLFKQSTLLAPSIKFLLWEICLQPKYWDILGVIVLKFLRKKIAKITRSQRGNYNAT